MPAPTGFGSLTILRFEVEKPFLGASIAGG
jgi:hypothetical protein